MILPLSTLLLLVAAAFLAGLVDAIGGGGGLISLPALLAAGLPPSLALGTNKGQSVFGSAAALLRFTRAKLVDGRVARVSFPASFLGSLAGAGLVLLIPPTALRPVVLALLVVVALALVFRPTSLAPRAEGRSRALWVAALIAVVLGGYDGFFGPGSGTFMIYAFVWFFGARLQEASADAKAVNFAANLAAVILFAWHGQVLWRISLPMAVGQACGGFTGAHVAVRGGDRVVRVVVLMVVVLLVAKLGLDLVRG